MILNLTVGETRNGAKNWIDHRISRHFSRWNLLRVAFVLAGAATLDRLLTTRNLTSFIGFSGSLRRSAGSHEGYGNGGDLSSALFL